MLGVTVAYMRRHHVALLALFVALGGSATAASNMLRANSVGSAQVINGSLKKVDLSRKAIKALKGNKGERGVSGQRGATGPQGAQGVQGIQGIQGPPGPIKLTYVVSASIPNPASTQIPGTVTCPAGQYVTGGGATGGDGTTQAINSSFPEPLNGATAPNAWRVDMNNVGATDSDFFVYAICAPAASVTPFGTMLARTR